jgi:NADPH:quinone reductase-like Zn-dependent oxidoreductase
MARIVRFHEFGDPDVLTVEDIAVRPPAPGEVRIAVKAYGLNRADVLFRQGYHPTRAILPSMIGSEAAGFVESVGAGVDRFLIGDAVSVIPRVTADYGTCGELINVPAAYVEHSPGGLSMPEAASLWMACLTAAGGLIGTGGMARGDVVLLPAASSSVGLAAIQLAVMTGAIPIAVTRTAAKAEALREAGAHAAIASDTENVAVRVMALTGGKGARVIFDPIGGPGVAALAEAAAQDCDYVIYGALSFDPTPFPVALSFARRLAMRTFSLDPAAQDLECSKALIREGVANGHLRPIIDTTFPLERVADAYRRMESNQQIGKIVVTV